MTYLWYKLLFNMTKVEYIQGGQIYLIAKIISICPIYLCIYVKIVLSQVGYYLLIL